MNTISLIIYLISILGCWYISYRCLINTKLLCGGATEAGLIFVASFVPFLNTLMCFLIGMTELFEVLQNKYIKKK